MDPDTDVCQTEQPQISYSVDFTAEQSSAMGSPILLDREGSCCTDVAVWAGHARPTTSRLGPDFRAYVQIYIWKWFGEYEQIL